MPEIEPLTLCARAGARLNHNRAQKHTVIVNPINRFMLLQPPNGRSRYVKDLLDAALQSPHPAAQKNLEATVVHRLRLTNPNGKPCKIKFHTSVKPLLICKHIRQVIHEMYRCECTFPGRLPVAEDLRPNRFPPRRAERPRHPSPTSMNADGLPGAAIHLQRAGSLLPIRSPGSAHGAATLWLGAPLKAALGG